MVTITPATATREHGWVAVQRPHDGRRRERYPGLWLLMAGQNGPEVARWRYRDEEPMRPWGPAGNDGGLSGRARAPLPGRPTGLTAAPRLQVTEAGRPCPRARGAHLRPGTTPGVRHCIAARFGSASERGRQWRPGRGCRWRRLRPRHRRAQPGEQAAGARERRDLWAPWPADEAWRLIEEATVRRHPTLTAPWGLVDEGPDVPTGDDHTQVHVYGAVAPRPGRAHDPSSPELGRGEFATCLRHRVVDDREKRRRVIPDRAPPHQGAPGATVAREADGPLRLRAQPASAPDLPPEARLGTWRRGVVTHQQGFESLTAHMAGSREVCRYLAGGKDPVRQLWGLQPPKLALHYCRRRVYGCALCSSP